ncbi:MAG: DUF1236 domain-containing protein [Aliihoeflea sp.]
MSTKLFVSVAAAALLTASAASAQTMATASTDLNVRAGPGPHYEVTGVIGVDEQATIMGCLEASQWCQVSYAGGEGWAYSDYLIAEYDGAEAVVTERRAEIGVPVAEYTAPASGGGAVAGGATGAVAGAIIGGPLGAAVGAVAGAATGGVAEGVLAADARTYVLENPGEPVYLEGEVVVGAQVPDTVEVREIPNHEYRYVYVNHQPVVVEPDTRRIVYIVR